MMVLVTADLNASVPSDSETTPGF